jgi:lysophospholipase L1-like esterase
VLTKLEDRHGYDVDSVAHNGDRLEDMAYSGAQFADFTRLLEKRLREGKIPRALLLSAGGNDVAGDELAVLLNHAASGLDPLNEDVVRGVIDVRLRTAFTAMIAGVTAIAERYLNRPLPIVVHGYARPVPDGRGYLGGWWKLPGPWLKPSFDLKGYRQGPSIVLMGRLVDRVNDMLAGVSATPGFSHVHYLDLRPLLGSGPKYKDDWANELHPSVRGFEKVADEFAGVIATFPA